MDRAYSLLRANEFAEGKNAEGRDVVTVTGIASTPTTDRYGDIVDPKGARFKTPMPLLWQHNHQAPVGHMTLATPTEKGIPFEAEIPIVKEAGRLQDRVNEAIHSLRYKLVNAVSIGFTIDEGEYELLETGGLKINSWEWLELSLVTIPANSEAVISAVKALDQQSLAAMGLDSDRDSKLAELRKRAGGTVRRKPIILRN
jgi:HK97 family phage prohead protease